MICPSITISTLHRGRPILLLVMAACALLAGCQRSGTVDGGDGGQSIDGFRYRDVIYANWSGLTPQPAGMRAVTAADLGATVGRIRSNRTDEPVESAVPLQDLEATVLDAGSSVYTVKGYPAAFRLAVARGGKLVTYEPWKITRGHVTGADLLGPVRSRTRRIDVFDAQTLARLGSIDDAKRVRRLAGLVAGAPVAGQEPAGQEQLYVVVFHLADGTGVARLFNTTTGYLAGAIRAPREFTVAILRTAGR